MKVKRKYAVVLILLMAVGFVSCQQKDGETIVVEKNDKTYLPENIRPLLDDEQHKAFNFFYSGANAQTGLAYEGSNRTELATGGTGFGLMALVVGAERNWITRDQAAKRVVMILNFFKHCERFHGMWSHWYKPDGNALAFGNQVKTGDIVESGFLTAGILTAQQYFNGTSDDEIQIKKLADNLYNSIDWNFYTNGQNRLYWLWHSPENKFELPLTGWNEAWISYILALGAPANHRISVQAYRSGWQSDGAYYHTGRSFYGYELPLSSDLGGPLFLSHYSMLGLNPKLMQDEHVYYWKQCVDHAMINRHYCVYEAPKQNGYGVSDWGLTACCGAGSKSNYSARSPHNDDGIIAPTAALSSYPYVPFYATQALMKFKSLDYLNGTYGLGDSYCPAEKAATKGVLAIDEGPIVVMIENYRSGLIWKLLMANNAILKGLTLAGVKQIPQFHEGFYAAVVNTKTKVYDMMIHPDREKYELDYFVENAGSVQFSILDDSGKNVLTQNVSARQGQNIFSFFDETIKRGKAYTIKMETKNKTYSISVILR